MVKKKSVAPVLEISLLLLVVVSAGLYFQYWYTSYNSAKLAKAEMSGYNDNVRILDFLKTSPTTGVLFLKTKQGYEILDQIRIGGTNCELPGSNVVTPEATSVQIICPPSALGNGTDVAVITNSEIYQSTIDTSS